MLAFFQENAATILVGLAVAALLGLALWSILRDRKRGGHACCGGDCSGCCSCSHGNGCNAK